MLPKKFREIDEAALTQMCKANWQESGTLDFKMKIPAATAEDRLETAKDICAFANGNGGVIIVGIAQATGGAGTIKPITEENFDQAQRRILQIIESKIEPRLESLQFQEVRVTNGFVMLVQVPKSYVGPHSHGDKIDSRRFVVREGTQTMDMTFEQLRSSFDRTSSLRQRASTFIHERVSKISGAHGYHPVGSAGPTSVLHIVPISAMTGDMSLDIAALAMDRTKLLPHGWRDFSTYPNLDGLLKQPYGDGKYMQLFRTGAVEIVEACHLPNNDNKLVHAGYLTQFFRLNFDLFLDYLKSFGITGPAVVCASVVTLQHYKLYAGLNPAGSGVPDRFHISVPPFWIEDIEAVKDTDEVMKPMMDVLWQSFGEIKCAEYDENGKWSAYNYNGF